MTKAFKRLALLNMILLAATIALKYSPYKQFQVFGIILSIFVFILVALRARVELHLNAKRNMTMEPITLDFPSASVTVHINKKKNKQIVMCDVKGQKRKISINKKEHIARLEPKEIAIPINPQKGFQIVMLPPEVALLPEKTNR